MDPEDYETEKPDRQLHPLTIQLYLINTILIEKINSQHYWQIVQLAMLWYSTYFLINNAEEIIKNGNDWLWLGDAVFFSVCSWALNDFWKARQKIKRLQAASDIVYEFATGKASNFERVEAAVNQALPGMCKIHECHEGEEE